MSRGLGPKQERLLAMLAARRYGLYTADLSALLDVQPRRARAIVASLVERGLVEVARDKGEVPRAWLPEHRRAKESFAGLLDWSSRRETNCPSCGQPVIRTPSGRIFRWRAIEPESIVGKGWGQANGA